MNDVWNARRLRPRHGARQDEGDRRGPQGDHDHQLIKHHQRRMCFCVFFALFSARAFPLGGREVRRCAEGRFCYLVLVLSTGRRADAQAVQEGGARRCDGDHHGVLLWLPHGHARGHLTHSLPHPVVLGPPTLQFHLPGQVVDLFSSDITIFLALPCNFWVAPAAHTAMVSRRRILSVTRQ